MGRRVVVQDARIGARPVAVQGEGTQRDLLTFGSLNKGSRSAVLDGETVFVLSGDWSMIGWPDFFPEWGFVTWVSGPEELEQYLPPYSGTQRWVGRRMRRIL